MNGLILAEIPMDERVRQCFANGDRREVFNAELLARFDSDGGDGKSGGDDFEDFSEGRHERPAPSSAVVGLTPRSLSVLVNEEFLGGAAWVCDEQYLSCPCEKPLVGHKSQASSDFFLRRAGQSGSSVIARQSQ